MDFHNSYHGTGVDVDVVRLANKRAHSLTKRPGFCANDLEDLQQELICAAIEQLPKFDSARRGKLTFIGGILDKKAAQLFRNRMREKRDPTREAFSLDAAVPDSDDEAVAYSDLVADENYRAWRLRDLVIDVREALASLSPKLRIFAEFHVELRPSEVRKAAGMSKSSHHRAIKQLRKHFERAGFEKKKKNPEPFGARREIQEGDRNEGSSAPILNSASRAGACFATPLWGRA